MAELFSNYTQTSTEHAELPVDQEFYFQWHLTERCNRRCRHCYHDDFASKGELDDATLHEVARRLLQALEAWDRIGSVSLTGGEPWLRSGMVLELLDRFDDSDRVAHVDLLSNGTLLDVAACKALAEKPVLRRVQVSMEGGTAKTHDSIRGEGSFGETERAVRRMKDAGLTVAVMMTVSRLNFTEVLDAVSRAGEWGVDVFSIDRFIPEGQARDLKEWVLEPTELRDLYVRLHERAIREPNPRVLMYRPLFCLVDSESEHVGAMCSVGTNALTIMHEGTVYPCRRLPIPLGNILTDSLHEIWYSSPILWQARDPANLKGKCGDCEFVPVCRGCRAMALAMRGDWLEEDPQCWK